MGGGAQYENKDIIKDCDYWSMRAEELNKGLEAVVAAVKGEQ